MNFPPSLHRYPAKAIPLWQFQTFQRHVWYLKSAREGCYLFQKILLTHLLRQLPWSSMEKNSSLNASHSMSSSTVTILSSVTTEPGPTYPNANLLGNPHHYLIRKTQSFISGYRCKHLPKAPKNGMVIAPKMEHNMKARFTCKDGFTVKGKEFIECSYGNWTGEIPICQEGTVLNILKVLGP